MWVIRRAIIQLLQPICHAVHLVDLSLDPGWIIEVATTPSVAESSEGDTPVPYEPSVTEVGQDFIIIVTIFAQ